MLVKLFAVLLNVTVKFVPVLSQFAANELLALRIPEPFTFE